MIFHLENLEKAYKKIRKKLENKNQWNLKKTNWNDDFLLTDKETTKPKSYQHTL